MGEAPLFTWNALTARHGVRTLHVPCRARPGQEKGEEAVASSPTCRSEGDTLRLRLTLGRCVELAPVVGGHLTCLLQVATRQTAVPLGVALQVAGHLGGHLLLAHIGRQCKDPSHPVGNVLLVRANREAAAVQVGGPLRSPLMWLL